MADRALVDIVLLSALGIPRVSKTLTFYEENGTTPLAQSLYAAESGGSALVPPYLTNSVGTFRAYAPIAQDAVCLASDDSTAFPVQFNADQSDEALRNQSDVPFASLIVGPDQTTDIPLAVVGQVAQTANLQEWRNSSGTVLHSMGVDDAKLHGSVTIKGTVTGAKIQGLLDAGFLSLIIPEGTHAISTKITVPQGASIRGMGNLATILSWTGSSSSIMFEYVSIPVTSSHISISNLCLKTTVATTTGIRIINGGFEVFENLLFLGIETHFYLSGGPMPSLRNIAVSGNAPRTAGGSYFASLAHLEISGWKSFQTSTATAVLTFDAIASATISNVNLYAPTNIGIIVQGDSQGMVFTGGVMTSVTKGIVLQVANASNPSFIEFIGYKIDQATTNAVEVNQGSQIHFTRCELTNTSGVANGVVLAAAADAIRVRFLLCTFENIALNGILAVAGAGYFEVLGCNFITCGASGAGRCVAIGAGVSDDVYVAHNIMTDNAIGTISDGATSGARRRYIGNAYTLAPVFTNQTGVTVQDAGGFFGIGDASNAKSTIGLTINQGAADDEILSVKSSDVAHGVTGTTETDTYGFMKKASATGGGLQIAGVAEDATVIGLELLAVGDTNTTHSTAGTGYVTISCYENDGTATAANPTANSNLLAVRAGTTTRFMLDADGDSHQDVGTAWTNFHGHDDIGLVTALAANVSRLGDPIRHDFEAFLFEKRDELERLKLVTFNEDGRPFVNMSKLTMLLVGAVQQVATRFETLERRLDALTLSGARE